DRCRQLRPVFGGGRVRPAGPPRRTRLGAGKRAPSLHHGVVDRRDDARARSRHDQRRDSRRQPRQPSQPRPHPRPGRQVSRRRGAPIPSATLARAAAYCGGRLKAGTGYPRAFPEQRGMDGVRIPTLLEVFDLTRQAKAEHVRFNIETKLTPTSGADTPDPETFAAAMVRAVREAGLSARVSIQSFDWRTLVIARRIAPEIERVCLSIDGGSGDTLQRGRPGASPWTAGLDIDDFAGSAPRLVAAAGCSVWSPNQRDVTAASLAEAKALSLKVIPW